MTILLGIYCRVSSQEQRKGQTIEGQKLQINGWLSAQEPRPLAKWYLDDGYSGEEPLHSRPAGAKLLAAIEDKEIDTVVVVKMDRLSRSYVDGHAAMAEFQRKGVTFRALDQSFDIEQPDGMYMASQFLSFAAYERAAIKQRLFVGRQRNALKGGWNGGKLPFGYCWDQSGRIQVAEEEAEVYRLIVSLASQGLGANKIQRELAERKIKSPTGQETWHKNAINWILKNRFYLGEICYGEINVKANHPALITPDEHEAITISIASRGHGRQVEAAHLLSGLLKCNCGGGMAVRYTGRGTKETGAPRRYCCNHKYESAKRCRQQLLDADSLEAAVMEEVFRLAQGENFLAAVRAEVADRRDSKEQLREIARLEKSQAEVTRLIKAKDNLFAKGILADDEYEAAMVELYRQARDLAERREQMEAAIQVELQDQGRQLDLLAAFRELPKYWDKFDPAARQAAVKFLIREVRVLDQAVEVDFFDFTINIQPVRIVRGTFYFL